MKLSLKILAIAIIAATTYSIIGCAAPASFSYQNIGITFSASCSDCPIGIVYNPALPQPPAAGSALMLANAGQSGTALITATVTNAPQVVTWAIYPLPNLGGVDTAPTSTTGAPGESGSSVGSINAQSGNTVYYTQNGVPIYSGAALLQAQAMGIPQGDVLVMATVQSDPTNPNATVSVGQLVQIYGSSATPYLTPHTPLTPAGLTNPVVTVARNTSYQFYGGVAGSPPCTPPTGSTTCTGGIPAYTVDNGAIWEVCPAPFAVAGCIVGGNTTLGIITQSGLYTAPAAIPSPLPIVFVASHSSPSISNTGNYAYVGVN